MSRSRPVARLATDIYLRILCGECPLDLVVVFPDVRGVTIGTHEVPVLIDSGPMKRIFAGYFLCWIEKKPTAATLIARTAIPRDAQSLELASWHLNQVLLERIDAKCEFDFVIMERTVGTICSYPEFRTLAVKRRSDTQISEAGLIEISQDRIGGCLAHRLLVVRSIP